MNQTGPPSQVWGLVPAAGVGCRMGGPKQTFQYGGSTLTGRVVGTLLDAGVTGVVVVTRSPLVPKLELPSDPRVETACNDDEGSEMIDSIRIGLAHLAEHHTLLPVDGIAVVPADMPRLSAAACRACIRSYLQDPHAIVVAAHGSRRGHPIIFPFALRTAVGDLPAGLNGLMQEFPERVRTVETADPSVAADVNTPADYKEIRSHVDNSEVHP